MPEVVSKIMEWRSERAAAFAKAQDIHERATQEKRQLNPEEKREFDQWIGKGQELTQTIEREEQLRDLERLSLHQNSEGRTSEAPKPGDPQAFTPTTEPRDNQLADLENRQLAAYRGFCALGENGLNADERRDLGTARTQLLYPDAKTPKEVRAMTAGLSTSGGFLYPPMVWSRNLIKALDAALHIRTIATTETVMNADSLGVPTIEEDPADPEWTTEIGTGSDNGDMKLGGRQLTPHPLARRAKISETLLRKSAGRAENIVMDRLRYRVGATQELYFSLGNGEGQPLGYFYPSEHGIPTSRDVSEGNVAADGVTPEMSIDGLIHAKYALRAGYWQRARWIFHQDAIKELILLKNEERNYVWQPSVQLGQPDRLLNLPLIMSEFAPNVYAPGMYFGILGDFGYYHIVDSLSLQIKRLNELYSEENKVGFILRLETDGMPILAEAFVRLQLPN